MIEKTMSQKRPPILLTDIKLLYGRAAGRCSFPKCGERLIRELDNKSIHIGEMAHIIANSPEGPRSDVNCPKKNYLLMKI